MFKKLAISICMLIALCTNVCAYAEQEEIESLKLADGTVLTDVKEEIHFDEEQSPLKETSVDMHFDEISERLSKKINLKKPEEFVHLMKGNSRVVYNNVSDYTNFICTNDFDEEQLKTINRILENGTTIQSLIQVYEFWLTTDYNFSMVEEICALEDKYFSEYWYESAFNSITNNIHGVLNIDDINYYRDLGISDDEILAANVLCRKQGQNIFEILDAVVNGVDIETQAKDIYGVDSLPEGKDLYRRIIELSKSVVLEFNKITPTAKQTTIDSKEIANSFIAEKIGMEAERLKISEPEINNKEDYEALLRSRLPLSAQRTLLNKGYTPTEIEQASKAGGWYIAETIKQVREAQSK